MSEHMLKQHAHADVFSRNNRHTYEPKHLPATGPSNQQDEIIQRKASCACGGGCPRCQMETSGEDIQTKLKVSSPGDQYEQQADRIAEQVMHMPVSETESVGLSAMPHAHHETRVLAKGHSHGARMTPRAEAAIKSVSGAGQPLSATTRNYFEPLFGRDLGGVRVHADTEAASAARAVNARAYTRGNNIVFGAGEYAPTTPDGKHLLAHELAHVAQQGGGLELVQREIDDEMNDPAVAGDQDVDDADPAEPIEAKGGRGHCRADTTISRLIHNFTDIDFTVPRGCTATVRFSALYVMIGPGTDCCSGRATYTLTRNGGAAQRLPVGANRCGDSDEHPRSERTLTMGAGRQLLHVVVERGDCEGISMDLALHVSIR